MTARRNDKRAAARIRESVKRMETPGRGRPTEITTTLGGKNSCH
jgi:hypothetical protein